jgi:hypothetical protein
VFVDSDRPRHRRHRAHGDGWGVEADYTIHVGTPWSG